MSRVTKAIGNFLHFVFIGTPLGLIAVVLGGLVAMVMGLGHADDAARMHREHDVYVLNQEICRVHHGWYVPSHNIPNMSPCRRLSDHRLFFVQNTGRELVPNEE